MSGGIIFGFFGALVRWILNGFRKSFKTIYKPETIFDDTSDIASEEMKNIVIGALSILILIIILHEYINIL